MSQDQSPSWDNPILRVTSESQWRAQYRLLQSWYREIIIGAPPGIYRGRQRGNHLSQKWLEDHPHANFLSSEVGKYVERRVVEAKAEGATLEEERLRSNMLSSMPLCFNLFGHLRAYPQDAAAPLALAFDLDISEITRIEMEWGPNPEEHLRDRTAFDAYIEYLDSNGKSGFIGVETKYTESFSPIEYESDEYTTVTNSSESGFKPEAEKILKGRKTNQLWRNAMLVVSHRSKSKFTYGHVAVVHCDGDRGLESAITKFEAQLSDRDSLLRIASLETIIGELASVEVFKKFAAEFTRRYLDLSPIMVDHAH